MPAFIVLDGPDGSGTTTQAKFLVERFEKEGIPALLTAEPTGGPVGKQIRDMLSSGVEDPMALQLLFTTDRAWHVENVVMPALAEGKVVVCDRYWHSTVIYAEAQGLDGDALRHLNEKFLRPDAVVFTLPPLEVSMRRVMKRQTREIFEREELQRKIHAGYEREAERDPSILVVDTSGEKPVVSEQIWRFVQEKL